MLALTIVRPLAHTLGDICRPYHFRLVALSRIRPKANAGSLVAFHLSHQKAGRVREGTLQPVHDRVWCNGPLILQTLGASWNLPT